MNIRTSAARLGLVLVVTLAGELRADLVTVHFTATVDESPFGTPGYTIGSVITGWYTYETPSVPFDSGYNYAMYDMPGMHLLLGSMAYEASSGGRLDLVHLLPDLISPDPVDIYDLFGYSLTGPDVEGFSPAFSELKLTDTDNSVYANVSPIPIDLPDPGVFEIQQLTVCFLQGSPPTSSRYIYAKVDSLVRSPDGHDSEPPHIIRVNASPNSLWSPNGRMVPVEIGVVATDNVGITSTKIVSVTSNELVKDVGNRKGEPDWEITGDLSVNLRAKKTGAGSARIYTIVVQCADAAGNKSIGQTRVLVPHSLGAAK